MAKVSNNSPMCVAKNGTYFISGQLPADLEADISDQTTSSLEKIESLLTAHG